MQDLNQLPGEVAWLAFALALVFGAIANWANFCTMGAITDVVHVGDWRRMRMWLLAIAVAIAGGVATAVWIAMRALDPNGRIETVACLALVGGIATGVYAVAIRRWWRSPSLIAREL